MKRKGAILFICLWALVILSIFSLGIANRVNSEMQLARYLRDSVISLYCAYAAQNLALLGLQKDTTPNFYSYSELQKKQTGQLGIGSFTFNFSDEEGRININTADKSTIQRLPGLNEELAQAIIESGLRPFVRKEEILLAKGITKEIFLQFKDLVTVYGSGPVNINTASEEVFKVLGLPDDTVEAILNYRKGEDGEEFTDDDRAYASLPPYVPANLFGTASNYLRLNISTDVLGKKVKDYYITFEVSSGRIRIWQEV